MRAQEKHRVVKSQQIRMRIKHAHCLNATYPSGLHHSDFMAAGAIAALGVTDTAAAIEPLVACPL